VNEKVGARSMERELVFLPRLGGRIEYPHGWGKKKKKGAFARCVGLSQKEELFPMRAIS